MPRLRALAVDIDGTLTINRGIFTLDLEAINMLRELSSHGIHIILVTGNSLPVTAGLARYLGFDYSPHVAENGCMVFYRGSRIRTCTGDASTAARLVEEHLSDILYPSWQNPYRHCDYAFNLRSGVDPQAALEKVRNLLHREGLEGISIGYSGYAIHVKPSCVSKARGLLKALELVGVKTTETVAIGDSALDVELKHASAVLVAVGNADEELKQAAHIVAPGRSSESVKWLVKLLLEKNLELDGLLSQ
ncbi:SPP-like hydrolase [Pyrolobus fumarii 1A]|uniref:Phosphoglycolate phosphatase n=1 Tax=Pyrolobus fumarii (strain DSM 11204 / 1A) TaxID=694429 RepID=G0EH98_PYRF1|nr:phosphoglycolate phosphatase [Pyrolobus fumarii]AEM39322.1 SPP-like hydrolase [Pyrolobus fumarii 1A]